VTGRLPLNGETVVVTGEVPDMERDAAQQAARELGAKVVSSVTATTTMVVHGPGAGRSKLDKAAARGLRLLDAAAFAVLAQNPDSWDGEPLGEPAGAARDEDLDRELPSTSRPAEPDHRLNTTSASPGGVWTVWGSCRCGAWKVRVDSTAEARAQYAEHHVDEPDDESLAIAQLRAQVPQSAR
jgi:hypothetical protein